MSDNMPRGMAKALELIAKDPDGTSVDLREFVSELIGEFGGQSTFAKAVVRVFNDAPAGSNIRASMVKNITTILAKATEMNDGSYREPSEMTDDQLLAEADLFKQLMADDEPDSSEPQSDGEPVH